jgi:hypothetical protein
MKEELHERISDDRIEEANQILQDYAMRWFAFGMGVGIVFTSIIYGIVLINK